MNRDYSNYYKHKFYDRNYEGSIYVILKCKSRGIVMQAGYMLAHETLSIVSPLTKGGESKINWKCVRFFG